MWVVKVIYMMHYWRVLRISWWRPPDQNLCHMADRIKRWVVVNEWFNVTGDIRDDFLFPSTLGVDGISRVCHLKCAAAHHMEWLAF